MALLDFLKKKEDQKKSQKAEKKATKTSVAPKTVKEVPAKKEETKVAPVREVKFDGKDNRFSYQAIKQPHISEKGTYLAEKNQYVFQTSVNSNKKEIKRAIEGMYKVNVVSVNIIKIPAKKRRLGKTEGFRKAYTKAIVTVKEGQKIEIL